MPCCFFWWDATPIRFFRWDWHSSGAVTGKNEGLADKATQSIEGCFLKNFKMYLKAAFKTLFLTF
jgi:hypothetical protein